MTGLIRREAARGIVEEIQKSLCPVGTWGRKYVYGADREKYDALEDILDRIDDIPEEDVAPVQHGEWEFEHETYGKVRCSRCKKEALLEKADGDVGTILLYVYSNYCPHCGCKMDGGARNES